MKLYGSPGACSPPLSRWISQSVPENRGYSPIPALHAPRTADDAGDLRTAKEGLSKP